MSFCHILMRYVFYIFFCGKPIFYIFLTASAAALAISRSSSTVPPETPMDPINSPLLFLKNAVFVQNSQKVVPKPKIHSARKSDETLIGMLQPIDRLARLGHWAKHPRLLLKQGRGLSLDTKYILIDLDFCLRIRSEISIFYCKSSQFTTTPKCLF